MAKKKSAEEKKKEFAQTWIVQLDDDVAKEVSTTYDNMERSFLHDEAQRISKLSVDEIKALLENGPRKAPNKHDFATKIFLLGWKAYNKS